MGYDPFSPIAPALINVLCVPAGRLSQERFTTYVRWLAKHVSVLTKVPREEAVQSSDLAENHQVLLLSFSAYADPQFIQRSAFFEPNRQPQIVLGLVDGSTSPSNVEDTSSDAHLQEAHLRLKRLVARTSGLEPHYSVLVFDTPDSFQTPGVLFASCNADAQASDGLTQWLCSVVATTCTRAIEHLRSQEAELPQAALMFDRLSGSEAVRDSSEDLRSQSLPSTLTQPNVQSQPSSVPEEDAYASTSGKIVSEALLKLQSGSWADALDRLADGARAARDANSPAWHAKALDAMLVCLLLHAWAGKDFQIPQNCYPTSRGFPSGGAVHAIAETNRAISEKYAGGNAPRLQALTAMLPGLLATIISLYDRAIMGFDNGFPPLLACEARIRSASMLTTIRKHASLISVSTLEEICGPRPKPNFGPTPEPPTNGLFLKGSALASLLIESINDAQAHLHVQATSMIYLAACQNLTELQLDRKHGFILKDVLQKLPPVLVEARKIGTAEAAIHPSSNGLETSVSTDKNNARVASSIRALLQLAIQLYGLPGPLPESDQKDTNAFAKGRLESWRSLFVSGDIATKLEVVRLCVRVSDALPDLKGSVQFMSLLLFIARQTVTVRSGPGNAVPLLSVEEQTRLASGIHNTINAASRMSGAHILAQYWDDFLVRGIELYESPGSGKLMPHSSQDLSLSTRSGINKKTPFIYNPFSGDRNTSGPMVLVKDEIACFDILLQNPLEIDIEIESIALIGEGCDFAAQSHNMIIGPLTTQVFNLQGTPTATGTLRMVGCKAKVKNCHEQRFAIFDGVFRAPHSMQRKQFNGVSLDLPLTKVLELTVVDPLPQLHLQSTNLVQHNLMLLDGQLTRFSITLENTGALPADLVLFGFEDSSSRQIQEALATKDLPPADTHELQRQLTHRPAIKRISTATRNGQENHAIDVAPQSTATFEFEVLGKPGLTEVVVLIDYAFLGKPRSEVEGTFHTRQIKIPVAVSVIASVDIVRCGVLSIPESSIPTQPPPQSQTNGKSSATGTTNQDNSMANAGDHDQCLLQLDLRSTWQTPLTITIEEASSTSSPDASIAWDLATSTTLLPNQTSRTLTLLPQIYISNPHAPIPNLSSSTRQFVVSASKLSLEAELTSREAFWYREEVCKRLRIRWKEEHLANGKVREGDIDLRKGLRLGQRMIDSLRIEHVQISFQIVTAQDARTDETTDRVVRRGQHEFQIQRNTFARLIVTISNKSAEDLQLLLRVQPSLADQPHNVAMDLSKRFVCSGALQKALKGGVKASGSVQSNLGIVCLASGVYEINASVEEIRGRRRDIEGVAAGQSGGGERRIWHARRACRIHAVEEEEPPS